mmetsp:Transcript_3717/g.6569  ORF Transcript_3717/g.6569 Transcript_3717/m.6569 type:complete len:108 (+) Transcript_3717:1614-1937(+)
MVILLAAQCLVQANPGQKCIYYLPGWVVLCPQCSVQEPACGQHALKYICVQALLQDPAGGLWVLESGPPVMCASPFSGTKYLSGCVLLQFPTFERVAKNGLTSAPIS